MILGLFPRFHGKYSLKWRWPPPPLLLKGGIEESEGEDEMGEICLPLNTIQIQDL